MTTLKQLREMPDDEVIRLYDEHATHTVTGTDFYRQELERRTGERSTTTIIRLTWAIFAATIVLGILTVVLIVLTAVLVGKS